MRFLKFSLVAILSIIAINAHGGNKIKYYFNHPPYTPVSTGTDAVNLYGLIDDTLVAYINRAHYTLDIAVYNFTSYTGASLTNVQVAINSAYARGVKIRWIYNGTSATANSGLTGINSAIPTLASPSATGYNIMHNKFMVVDANSSNPDDAIVWTGSTNWSVQQFNQDYDNVVIVQDSALAHAYRAEFNMMWGDTGMVANTANSKFGPDKTDLGRHTFTIEGKQVELYFSPSDNTNDHIYSAIQSADKDLYFGVYTFTYGSDATAIVNKKNAGVYVAGILDQYSVTASGSEYPALHASLGANLEVYNGSYIYHNKYLVVDPSDACSDPQVLTGSHNWTSSANNENDENTLIIHDATAANIYYQAFLGDFYALGGSPLTKIYGCTSNVGSTSTLNEGFEVYPNPTMADFNVSLQLDVPQLVSAYLIDMSGKSYSLLVNNFQSSGLITLPFKTPAPGIYILKIVTANNVYNSQIVSK